MTAENRRAIKPPAMPGQTDILKGDAPEVDALLDNPDPSLLKRSAPGVFELAIDTHDFALIAVE